MSDPVVAAVGGAGTHETAAAAAVPPLPSVAAARPAFVLPARGLPVAAGAAAPAAFRLPAVDKRKAHIRTLLQRADALVTHIMTPAETARIMGAAGVRLRLTQVWDVWCLVGQSTRLGSDQVRALLAAVAAVAASYTAIEREGKQQLAATDDTSASAIDAAFAAVEGAVAGLRSLMAALAAEYPVQGMREVVDPATSGDGDGAATRDGTEWLACALRAYTRVHGRERVGVLELVNRLHDAARSDDGAGGLDWEAAAAVRAALMQRFGGTRRLVAGSLIHYFRKASTAVPPEFRDVLDVTSRSLDADEARLGARYARGGR